MMKRELISILLICTLGIAGCGKSGSSDSSSAPAGAAAAHNIVGSGAASSDLSLTVAHYDADGAGKITTIDGEPVSSAGAGTVSSYDASSEGSTAGSSSSASDGTGTENADTGTESADTGTESVSASVSSGSDNGTETGGSAVRIDMSEEASSENQKAARCLASLDNISWSKGITTFGGYTPSPAILKTLQDTTDAITSESMATGFMIMDLNTCAGVCYNSDAKFYSSDAASAAFIIGTLNGDPTSLSNHGEEFQIVASGGNRDTWYTLMNYYGFTYMNSWLSSGGIDAVADGSGGAYLSAEDLTRLWLKNYQYFTTDTNGSTAQVWFQSPQNSALRDTLGSSYTTESVPGSLSDSETPDNDTTCEGGIVHDGDNPYIIAVMTDYAAKPEKLRPLISALNASHSELLRAAGKSS